MPLIPAADGTYAACDGKRLADTDILLFHRQELAELRIHSGGDHGALRIRITVIRTLSVPTRRCPRRRSQRHRSLWKNRSVDHRERPLAYDASQETGCLKHSCGHGRPSQYPATFRKKPMFLKKGIFLARNIVSKFQVMTRIAIKRVYEPEEASDGFRVLVDKLWPRGIRKEALPFDL